MDYAVLKEIPPNGFQPTGEVFTGTPEEAETYRQYLQNNDGGCYAMQLQS